MQSVIFLLGGNIGNVEETFMHAKLLLQKRLGLVVSSSALYRSPAWGFAHENDFLNQIIVVHTNQTPKACLTAALETEIDLGRTRSGGVGYEARIIDIDILFYENEIIDTESLTVPHPHIQERRFTLLPLCEIMPHYVHPILEKTCVQLLEECVDKSKVEKLLFAN